jgi:ATP-dependent helicase HrpB
VAKRRATTPAAGEGQFLLANGRGAALPLSDPLSAADWLAVADLDGAGRDARIFLAAPIDRAEIAELFADDLRTVEHVAWDDREEAVAARRQVRFGELVLEEAPLKDPPAGAVQAALLRGIAEMGLGCLPWTPDLTAWRARVAFLRRLEGAEAWPDLSDAALGASLADWLGPFLDGITRRAHLARIDLTAALHGLLAWPQRKALDERAPTHVTVPSGSRRPVDYAVEEGPVLAVRLQEMFGLAETPPVAGGRVRLLLHLLSPAGRPVQVTRDLASFWKNGYPAVRADLRGRYPKHFWPDDPLAAPPTARAKRPGA